MASLSQKIDYIFITEPSDSLKCTICLEVARDPKQCEDCGKLFCSECIEKHGKEPCPNCKKENPKYFKDVRGARDIEKLGVRCNSMERGCRWTGTIDTLDNHMSSCQFAPVPCPNKCEDDGKSIIMRKDLDKHLKKTCPNRPFKCRHCGIKRTYASITEDHDNICDQKRVPCPNKEKGCRLSMERGKTKQHVRSVCDYTEVACAYESLGCAVRMLRKDIKKHEENDDNNHLHLSLRNACLREEQHKTLSGGEAIVFKLPGYTSKKEEDYKFHCQPFYSHPGGYKMCIRVDANGNGDGAGTHVSVFTELLEGPYDDQLHWPFMGTVTCELLNQLADDNHQSGTVQYEDTEFGTVGKCWGKQQFISHSALSHDPVKNTQYLKDDTLYFRVTVTVKDHKPWLLCSHHS